MIDCENEIFGIIEKALASEYPDIFVSSEYVMSPSSFPYVSVVEMDNTVDIRTQTSGNIENHANVMYQVDIYSNKTAGKKTECKAIAALIDNEFAALGFNRTMLQSIPNMDDEKIYRITGRYTAKISKEKIIYRR